MSDPRHSRRYQGQRYAIKSTLSTRKRERRRGVRGSEDGTRRQELATSDAVRLAVLAALNIADELFRTRRTRAASVATACRSRRHRKNRGCGPPAHCRTRAARSIDFCFARDG